MSKRSTVIIALFVILAGVAVALWMRQSKPQGKTTTSAPATGSALVGQLAPDFKLPLVGGGEVQLSSLRGKVVMVNFWATWCPPCKAEMPSMERLYAQLKNSGFELLAINVEVDGLEVLPEFLQQHPHTFPVAVDTEGDIQVQYGVFRFPESFIVDRDGKVVEHIIGARDWSERTTMDKLRTLIKG